MPRNGAGGVYSIRRGHRIPQDRCRAGADLVGDPRGRPLHQLLPRRYAESGRSSVSLPGGRIRLQLPPLHLLLVLRNDHRNHRNPARGRHERHLRLRDSRGHAASVPRVQTHPSSEHPLLRSHRPPRSSEAAGLPKFWYYVTGPIVIFVIDRIIGMRQEYKQLQILDAALLPSDIIYIKYKRPHSFQFRSGQWIRISCPAFSCSFNERHSFSIASAPQSPTIELYIKAVGPWTWNLRNEISIAQSTGCNFPVVHMTGPYGDGNQTWQNFEVAVMIGGGIGVTPFASTLADLAVETSSGKHTEIRCKKVYFLWICPSHKNYEWFVDELRSVEELTEGILEIHIFVTQFFHKFDLRTTMLYICEKHFRGDHSGMSMFTGLRATNHFGRPNFDAFFTFLQKRHYLTPEIGVFSCGPASVNDQIRKSCTNANRNRDAPFFIHRFETF